MVDGLESHLEGQAQVIRLGVNDLVGNSAAIRYRVRVLPTFVILDGAGQVVDTQSGPVARSALMEVIEPLLGEKSQES